MFTWKTLCPTKEKKPRPTLVGFSHSTNTGKSVTTWLPIYKVTHTLMSNTLGHNHLVLVSSRLGHKHSLSKEWKLNTLLTMLLAQANGTYNESSKILPKLNNFNHTSNNSVFSQLKAHTFFFNMKTDVFQIMFSFLK